MKLIFDWYSVPLRMVLTTVKECLNHSMTVTITPMHQKTPFPYRYSLHTFKNLPVGAGQ